MTDPRPVSAPSAAGTLSGLVGAAFAQPELPFLWDPEGASTRTPGGGSWTYGEAARRVERLRGALDALGLGPGDRVAVQVEKSAFALLLYVACVRSGVVYVPLNTGYTDAEVEYVVEDVEPALVVRDPRLGGSPAGRRTLGADVTGAGPLADLAASAGDEPAPDPVLAPGDPAAILYTSGTTGRPKGAVLSQRNLASNALALSDAWGFTPHDVLLHALPLFHTHGLFVATNCVLASRSSLRLLARFDVAAVLGHLDQCTVFMGIPTFYRRLLADERLTATACSSVRLFTSGSAPLPAEVHRQFTARTGHHIVERYGLTETSILTSNPPGAERPGTVGVPLTGVELRVGGHHHPGHPGQPGEAHEAAGGDEAGGDEAGGAGAIRVRGPNVFEGYWRRPELRATEFDEEGYFDTGDLGTLDADGYLTIVGRSKDVIISGGYNVYPKEVEEVLDTIDGVIESAVVGVDDADLGERVVAVVVAGAGAPTEAALRARARERLAGYKVPKSITFATELPRNAMGKVQKTLLRARLAATATGESEPTTPTGS
ncbi:MAG TPA: AMP-binding protein [Acidimicrobiales bacterium]|jgi:malonyl-CoA/methylmalonyl-CoA synthetase